MKKIDKVWSYSLLMFGVLLFGCKDDEPEPAPKAPSNLSATVVSDTQIQLSWTDNSTNETGFKIERKTGTNDYAVFYSTTKDATTFTDNVLNPSTTYSFRVFAVNVNDEPSQRSNEVTATTNGPPVLTTVSVTSITAFAAVGGGTITSDGGNPITVKGIVWSTAQNPTIALTTKTEDGTGTDSYSSSLSNLEAVTIYYVRAYATNSSGTGYGNEVSFTTDQIPAPEAPTNLTATTISEDQIDLSWTDNSTVEVGFNIERKTGAGAYAVVYTAGANETTYMDGSLDQNTTYTYRIYAVNINNVPSPNSNEATATTKGVPVLTTTEVTAITAYSAESGGEITNDGGTLLEATGLVWGIDPDPTVELNDKTNQGNGALIFGSLMTNLEWNTVYYVRAYATNAIGTGYGEELTFTTGQVTIQTETPGSITFFTAMSGGNIGNDGGYPITERGVVWDTEPDPDYTLSKTADGAGTGVFTSSVTGLVSNVKYYLRAYAVSSSGIIAYGPTMEFTTPGLDDNDGNTYPVVQIGTQLWMAENLMTTKYNDNTAITLETDNTTWSGLTTGAYSWYNNDEAANTEFFGALYNWYAVETGKVCPTGWHVPTDAEWSTLSTFLGGNSVAGGKMKVPGTIFWTPPNTAATNESGFNGRSIGARVGGGTFAGQGSNADYWTSTQKDASTAYPRDLQWDTGALNLEPNGTPKDFGFAVRCIKN